MACVKAGLGDMHGELENLRPTFERVSIQLEAAEEVDLL